MQRIYLDLFDDGIPKAIENPLDPENVGPFVWRVANTLRFQILLAVLFERRIVVPGVWAASSPMFLAVVGEFAKVFPKTIEKQGAVGTVDVPTASPFVFAFGPEAGDGSGPQRLARSLEWRIRGNRRLMFSPTLSQLGKLSQSDEKSLRTHLADQIKAVLDDTSGRMSIVSDLLVCSLEPTGESAIIQQAGLAFQAIFDHLDRRGTEHLTTFDLRAYEQRVATEVLRVKDAVMDDRHVEVFDDSALKGFRHFFEEIANLPLSQIMGLWQKLSSLDIPDADKLSLEAFGRLVLNRGYASALGVGGVSAVSFDAYTKEATRDIDRALLASMRGLGDEAGAGSPAAHDFVSMAISQRYDLVDTFNWKQTWRAVAGIAVDETWQAERTRLLDKLRALDEVALQDPGSWNDFFDRINAALRGHLALTPGGNDEGRTVTLVRTARKVTDVVGTAGKLLGHETEATVPLGVIRNLLDLPGKDADVYLSIKADRAYRRVVTSRSVSTLQSMLLALC